MNQNSFTSYLPSPSNLHLDYFLILKFLWNDSEQKFFLKIKQTVEFCLHFEGDFLGAAQLMWVFAVDLNEAWI